MPMLRELRPSTTARMRVRRSRDSPAAVRGSPDWPEEVGVRPAGLVLDDTHAYFALAAVRWSVLNRAAIVRVPKDGGSPIVLAEDTHYKVFDLAVDQTHVYWARTFDSSSG
jgi:hypothetical protein